MTHDPATIAAFVDGELDELTAQRIAREARDDHRLAAAIGAQRRLRERLSAHYAPVLEEEVPDRLTALLSEAAKVDTSLSARRAEKTRPRFSAMHWGAIAASLALGLTLGSNPWTPASPVATDKGVLVASGPLAQALDTQLASTQSRDADVRIGLTFTAKDGRTCRSFDSAALAGIGCRDADAWQLEHTTRGSAGGEYRQASSGAIAAAAAEMMVGAPFDAKAEAAAKAKDWAQQSL